MTIKHETKTKPNRSLAAAACAVLLLLHPRPGLHAAEGESGQPGEFLRYGVSVRSLALGKAYVSLAGDACGIYYNPASITRAENEHGLYGSHFRLFDNSDFTTLAWASNGLDRFSGGFKGFLFGPEAFWGITFLDFSSSGFEYRDSHDALLDEDFEIYQQALLVGFARELAGSQAVLGYGVNIKWAGQGIDDFKYNNSDWDFGLDLGAQLQLINPWVIKRIVPLRHLLPFRMGLDIQNVVQPKTGLGSTYERYPTMLKLGLSYMIDRLLGSGDLGVLVTADFDWMFGGFGKLLSWDRDGQREMCKYLGAEFHLNNSNLALLPRVGVYNLGEDWPWTAGLGFKWTLESRTLLFDIAHVSHDQLHDRDIFSRTDDYRISLTFDFGPRRDADYFMKRSARRRELRGCIRALSRYPLDDVTEAALALADEHDRKNRERYYQFIGGPTWGSYLYEHARESLQNGNIKRALKKAGKAKKEYKKAAKNGYGWFDIADLLNYSETLMILGQPYPSRIDSTRFEGEQLDSVLAPLYAHLDSAIVVMNVASDRISATEEGTLDKLHQLRRFYQLGVCYLQLGEKDPAGRSFEAALELEYGDNDSTRSMHLLSLYALGHCYMSSHRTVGRAIDTFERIINECDCNLSHDYPRFNLEGDMGCYPPSKDMNISDDAQYYIGECYLKQTPPDSVRALEAFAKVKRFYPGGDFAARADSAVEDLLRSSRLLTTFQDVEEEE